MSERANRIRICGYSLLFVGFCWLCASSFLLPVNVIAAESRFLSDGLPRKESYERNEVFDALSQLSRNIRHGLPSIYTLAFLMLIGALILARTPAARR